MVINYLVLSLSSWLEFFVIRYDENQLTALSLMLFARRDLIVDMFVVLFTICKIIHEFCHAHTLVPSVLCMLLPLQPMVLLAEMPALIVWCDCIHVVWSVGRYFEHCNGYL